MIVRTAERASVHLLTHPTRPPARVRGTFGVIEVLQLTSAELRETLGISLSETDVASPFELAAALTRRNGRRTEAHIRNDRLVRLIERRKNLLPCFVGYQEVAGVGTLPFMTDAVPGAWSLFFEEDGRMTLVERRGSLLAVTDDDALLEPARAAPVAERARALLFAGWGARARGHSRANA